MTDDRDLSFELSIISYKGSEARNTLRARKKLKDRAKTIE